MSEITQQQDLFCREYVAKNFNGFQAAIAAGYAEKSARVAASRLLTNDNISARIAELMQDRIKRTKIDADWVLNQAVKLHNRCMQGEPVLDRDGNETGEWKFEHAGANKSLELIGKHVNVQAFTEKQVSEITHKVDETLASKLTGGSKR